MRRNKYFFLPGVFLITVLSVAIFAALEANAGADEAIIKITAKRFEYSPSEITLKKGVPVVLDFTALDRLHGFSCPGLGLRTDIEPGKTNRVSFTPGKTGTFPFHCDNFCGEHHEDMTGTITVTE